METKKQNIFILPTTNFDKPKKKNSYLSKKLKALNESKRIKIRSQKNQEDKYHLYLDFFSQNKRERQFLKIYVVNKKTPENETKIQKATLLRDKKELELFGMSEPEEFQLNKDKFNADFIDYFEWLVYERKKADKSWKHTLKHLRIFSENKPVIFSSVTRNFCEEFKKYLVESLAPNTAHTYFSKLKTALKEAIRDGILDKASPAEFIIIKKEEVIREYLDIDEIRKLYHTSCCNEQTKRAFLFSCFTGLRISDVKKLVWGEIRSNFLLLRQKKSKSPVKIKLHKIAIEILDNQKKDNISLENNRVFDLIPSENKIANHLKKWVKDAKIDKHITFHCARHTFATLNISSGNDIFTVCQLLGQKDVRVTQIYTKLVDKKRDEAIDRLPSI